ncbi:MAG TPA: hypothetical protein VGN37_27330 [Actinocatenispora sp.]
MADRTQLGEIVQRVRDGRLRTLIGTVATRRRPQPDRAGEGEDDHPGSVTRNTVGRSVDSPPSPFDVSVETDRTLREGTLPPWTTASN